MCAMLLSRRIVHGSEPEMLPVLWLRFEIWSSASCGLQGLTRFPRPFANLPQNPIWLFVLSVSKFFRAFQFPHHASHNRGSSGDFLPNSPRTPQPSIPQSLFLPRRQRFYRFGHCTASSGDINLDLSYFDVAVGSAPFGRSEQIWPMDRQFRHQNRFNSAGISDGKKLTELKSGLTEGTGSHIPESLAR
jgi:hypothetical protein